MEKYIKAKNVAILGIIANFFLFLLKIFLAIISKSQGMIADSMMSITDVFSSVLTYIGNKLASKKRDKTHPYGYGKVEYVFTIIISIFMILLALSILYNSIKALINKEILIFSWNLVIVCIITIITKLLLYLYTSRLSKKYNSLIIKANSEDHRNDIFLTLSSLIGIIFSTISIHCLDGIAGISIGIWIIYISLKIFKSAYEILIDKDIDYKMKEEIKSKLKKEEQEIIKDIKGIPVGNGYIIILELNKSDNKKILRNVQKKILKLEFVEEVVKKYDM